MSESLERNWQFCEDLTGHLFSYFDGGYSAECEKCGQVFGYKRCREGSVPSCEDSDG